MNPSPASPSSSSARIMARPAVGRYMQLMDDMRAAVKWLEEHCGDAYTPEYALELQQQIRNYDDCNANYSKALAEALADEVFKRYASPNAPTVSMLEWVRTFRPGEKGDSD